MINRIYHWLKAAWQSLPFLEKYRATEFHELAKALKTQIFFISVYLLVALINAAAAITFPTYYSLGVFNAVSGGVVGGIAFMLFDFILKTSIALHRVVAARKTYRYNHVIVQYMRLLAASSENIPGPKHTYTYRDLSISDVAGNNHDVCQSSLGILFYDFYANLSDMLNGYSLSIVNSGRPLTHCMVELADMFQQHEVELKGG